MNHTKVGELSPAQEVGPPSGDKVTVTGLADIGEWYGIIVLMRYPYGLSPFPIAHLQVDPGAPTYRPLNDYQVWFASNENTNSL